MKTSNTPKISSIFNHDGGEQPVRLIKAAQAGKLLGGGPAPAAAHGAHPKPEIRLIKAGADYCDLEIVCGCGESTQVRCWNAPAANASNAVAA